MADSAFSTSADVLTEREEKQGRTPPKWVFGPFGRALVPLRRWWFDHVIEDVDYSGTIAKIAGDSTATPRYIFMTMMAAGIAILGMLLSSPAVVIGAMLLSPLMSPILGAGFALASGKIKWLKLSIKALLIGTLVAVAFCALIVLVSPLQTVTSEIAARTKPNLFDLLIAFFSALAGSYAMIRGRDGTIVGVAIATALMPPLAAVGFGLATLNWTVFGGALALYVTNFLTIALTATVMARIYGFRTDLSVRQGWFQNFGIFFVFVALAIPLGFSLSQIAFEAKAQGIVKQAIADEFPNSARVSELEFDWNADPLQVSGSVFTPRFEMQANTRIARSLERRLDRPVVVNVDQFQVGTDPGAAEQAALAQARAQEAAEASDRQVSELARSLALVAGVERKEVLVDRENKRALATARPLAGLRLSGYRDLERRLSSAASGWTVELRPPVLPLPRISLEDGEPDEEGIQALRLVEWAAKRTGNAILLTGPANALEPVSERLRKAGIIVSTRVGPGNAIEADWSLD